MVVVSLFPCFFLGLSCCALRGARCAFTAKKRMTHRQAICAVLQTLHRETRNTQHESRNAKRVTRNQKRLPRKANSDHSDLMVLYILKKLPVLESRS